MSCPKPSQPPQNETRGQEASDINTRKQMNFRSERKPNTAKVEPNPKPTVKPRTEPNPSATASKAGGTSGGPPTHPSEGQGRTMKMRFEFRMVINLDEDTAMTGMEYCSTSIVPGFNEKEPRPIYMMETEDDNPLNDPLKWKIYADWDADDLHSTGACKSLFP
jgi:hypothetical protein